MRVMVRRRRRKSSHIGQLKLSASPSYPATELGISASQYLLSVLAETIYGRTPKYILRGVCQILRPVSRLVRPLSLLTVRGQKNPRPACIIYACPRTVSARDLLVGGAKPRTH